MGYACATFAPKLVCFSKFNNLELMFLLISEIYTSVICFVLLRSNICDPRSWLVFVSQEMRKRDARRKLTGHLVSALLGHEKRGRIVPRVSLVFFRDQTIQKSIGKRSSPVGVRRTRCFDSGVPGRPRESQGVSGSKWVQKMCG